MDTEQAEPDLRACKYRLDPNADQIRALSQAVGAARVSFNMLIACNLDALKAGWAAERELIKAQAPTPSRPRENPWLPRTPNCKVTGSTPVGATENRPRRLLCGAVFFLTGVGFGLSRSGQPAPQFPDATTFHGLETLK